MTEMLLNWLDPLITRVEYDRVVALHLGVSQKSLSWGIETPENIPRLGEVIPC